MKKYKGNKGLLDKGVHLREHTFWLRNLSNEGAIRLEEKLISSHLILEWRDNFMEDIPFCVKLGLMKRRRFY